MRNLLSILMFTIFAVALTTQAQSAPMQKQTPPAGGPPKPFHLPEIQRFSLPNGLQVTMVPYGSIPKVEISVAVRAGNLNESASQISLADITGELMKEGTKSETSEQVAQEAASMGGSVDVSVGPDVTTISSDVLEEFGPKAVALLADVVRNPLLPESELPRLKQDALRNLSIQKSQSGPLAHERFLQVLYPDHPYGHLIN